MNCKHDTGTSIRHLFQNLTELNRRERIKPRCWLVKENLLKEVDSVSSILDSFRISITTYAPTILGFVTSSTPTLVRFRSPPEIPLSRAPPTSVVAHPESPSSDNMLSVKVSSSSSVVSFDKRSLAEKRIHSRGVEEIMRESSCATKAICLRISIFVGSTARLSRRTSASTVNEPALEVLPDNTFSKEVLPAPDGP